ncbi:hypothetical protein BgiBS90_022695, partial [Biomphalaria glabrata]
MSSTKGGRPNKNSVPTFMNRQEEVRGYFSNHSISINLTINPQRRREKKIASVGSPSISTLDGHNSLGGLVYRVGSTCIRLYIKIGWWKGVELVTEIAPCVEGIDTTLCE